MNIFETGDHHVKGRELDYPNKYCLWRGVKIKGRDIIGVEEEQRKKQIGWT